MQVTVNLPEELSLKIENLRKKLKIERSDIIQIALNKLVNEYVDISNKPYNKVKKYLGVAESGIPDLGSNHRKHLDNRIKK